MTLFIIMGLLIFVVLMLAAVGFQWPTVQWYSDVTLIRWMRWVLMIADPDGAACPNKCATWTGIRLLRQPKDYKLGDSYDVVWQWQYKEYPDYSKWERQ